MLTEREIIVWACQIPAQYSEDVVEKSIQHLPSVHQSYIRSFRKTDDRLTRLIGRLLWRQMLAQNKLGQDTFENPSFGPHGKPLETGFGISISHSADIVLLSFSGQEDIGIDVERVRSVDIPKFRKQFSEREIEDILSCPMPYDAFFEAWTRKESVVKALGKGLTKKLIEIEADSQGCFDIDQVKWQTRAIEMPTSYKAHVASTHLPDIEVRWWNFNELMELP